VIKGQNRILQRTYFLAMAKNVQVIIVAYAGLEGQLKFLSSCCTLSSFCNLSHPTLISNH